MCNHTVGSEEKKASPKMENVFPMAATGLMTKATTQKYFLLRKFIFHKDMHGLVILDYFLSIL